eukprot:gene11915-13882_t
MKKIVCVAVVGKGEYTSIVHATEALTSLQGSFVQSRRIFIDYSSGSKRERGDRNGGGDRHSLGGFAQSPASIPVNPTSRVYIGSYDMDTTSPQDLKVLFSEIGDILTSHFVDNKRHGGHYGGEKRGYGFVEYRTIDEAERAINRFNGYEFNGRKLTVNYATVPGANKPHSPTRGGGVARSVRDYSRMSPAEETFKSRSDTEYSQQQESSYVNNSSPVEPPTPPSNQYDDDEENPILGLLRDNEADPFVFSPCNSSVSVDMMDQSLPDKEAEKESIPATVDKTEKMEVVEMMEKDSDSEMKQEDVQEHQEKKDDKKAASVDIYDNLHLITPVAPATTIPNLPIPIPILAREQKISSTSSFISTVPMPPTLGPLPVVSPLPPTIASTTSSPYMSEELMKKITRETVFQMEGIMFGLKKELVAKQESNTRKSEETNRRLTGLVETSLSYLKDVANASTNVQDDVALLKTDVSIMKMDIKDMNMKLEQILIETKNLTRSKNSSTPVSNTLSHEQYGKLLGEIKKVSDAIPPPPSTTPEMSFGSVMKKLYPIDTLASKLFNVETKIESLDASIMRHIHDLKNELLSQTAIQGIVLSDDKKRTPTRKKDK